MFLGIRWDGIIAEASEKSLRADVFGVSTEDEKIIYLCEGKKELKRRSFGKVVGEAVELVFYPLLFHFLVLIS